MRTIFKKTVTGSIPQGYLNYAHLWTETKNLALKFLTPKTIFFFWSSSTLLFLICRRVRIRNPTIRNVCAFKALNFFFKVPRGAARHCDISSWRVGIGNTTMSELCAFSWVETKNFALQFLRPWMYFFFEISRVVVCHWFLMLESRERKRDDDGNYALCISPNEKFCAAVFKSFKIFFVETPSE